MSAQECYAGFDHEFILKVLKRENISYVVAPYEADAQMTFLAISNQVDAVLTEDSDLIPFGCPRVSYTESHSWILFISQSILCLGLLWGSPTLANLGNDHGFISKEYIFIGMRPFEEDQSKAIRAYAQSEQYHTSVESCGS